MPQSEFVLAEATPCACPTTSGLMPAAMAALLTAGSGDVATVEALVMVALLFLLTRGTSTVPPTVAPRNVVALM